MRYSSYIAPVAISLAKQHWIWNRKSVEGNLKQIGWQKCAHVGDRDDYLVGDDLRASVYHDGDCTDRIEVNFEVFRDVEQLIELEYEDKVDEFYEWFLGATRRIADVLGTPTFSNGAAAIGFPDDQDAVWLSLWKLESVRLMLQQRHEDRELPFRICLIAAPLAAE